MNLEWFVVRFLRAIGSKVEYKEGLYEVRLPPGSGLTDKEVIRFTFDRDLAMANPSYDLLTEGSLLVRRMISSARAQGFSASYEILRSASDSEIEEAVMKKWPSAVVTWTRPFPVLLSVFNYRLVLDSIHKKVMHFPVAVNVSTGRYEREVSLTINDVREVRDVRFDDQVDILGLYKRSKDYLIQIIDPVIKKEEESLQRSLEEELERIERYYEEVLRDMKEKEKTEADKLSREKNEKRRARIKKRLDALVKKNAERWKKLLLFKEHKVEEEHRRHTLNINIDLIGFALVRYTRYEVGLTLNNRGVTDSRVVYYDPVVGGVLDEVPGQE